MNCPYCNKEMEKGYISDNRRYKMLWLPEGTGFFLRTEKNIKKHNGMIISKSHLLEWDNPVAYACRICKKVIIEYED
ncbi:PF20097 family protein [Proteiniborus sp. MB09-C3]|uniref:PF20097 family protein n=1 Tax=Proteiniborus sp. MB09-C3 TaxID=3050072 RepID=UPI002555B499|nr:PF20097 family protein [Proteiniborus sp. MB09-C3]WIV13046.1 PF20097 family protein [Proteiniborus sp. MB09-C3]